MKLATLIDDAGEEFELEIIQEFDYKGKNYAVLYEEDCDCGDECDCHEEDTDCECTEECGDDCKCDCHKDEEADADEEGHIYVLEVNKDADGKETFNEVDAALMEELLPIVEKKLYPTEE